MPEAYEYRVELVDLPVSVRGVVAYDDDGYPTIYLNARLSRSAQVGALRHELAHIAHDDAYSADDIRTVERRAHDAELQKMP